MPEGTYHVLIIRDITMAIDAEFLRSQLPGMTVAVNSYPDEMNAVAIIDCGKEPNWAWADEVIKVGTCDTGRNRVDQTIGAHQDPEGTIVDMLEAAAPAEEGEL